MEGGLRIQGKTKNSTIEYPLVSMVTIVYNGANHINDTITSVTNQDYPNIEYIIIDGGSTDGTVDILKERSHEIDYWISEPDEGISDAFNKGISYCNGALIGLINADDWYEPKVVSKLMDYPDMNNLILTSTIFYGRTYRVMSDGKRKEKKASRLGWAVSVPFSHCSSFVTRTYYESYGIFSCKYRIAMDIDLITRGLKEANYLEVPYFVANQRDGGISDRMRLQGYLEYFEILKPKIGFLPALIGLFLKMVSFGKNTLVKKLFYN